MTAEIKETLRTFILERFLPGEDPSNLTDDLPLARSGILDSVSTLELVSFVEETFGLDLGAREASTEFDTIDTIAALIERKKS